jgi:hypothetical protein
MMMLKYTKEYAVSNFDCEIEFLHKFLLISECIRLGFEDIEDALIKSGYAKQYARIVSENSYESVEKLLKKNVKINTKILSMEREICMAQDGKFDYFLSVRVYYHKWKKLMFEFFNKTYIDKIINVKQKIRGGDL